MTFVSPDSIVKPSPSIRNLVKDQPVEQLPAAMPQKQVEPSAPTPQPPAQSTMTPEATSQPSAQPSTVVPPQTQPTTAIPPVQSEENPSVVVPSVPTDEVPQSAESRMIPSFTVGSEKYNEAFLACWNEMIEVVFDDVQTLKTPLHDYPVEVIDNVVRVILRNQFQMDDFAIKKNAVLQYLRSHFDERINDVVPEMDTVTESKKYILDEKDKLAALRQENPDIMDFIQILNLRLKN